MVVGPVFVELFRCDALLAVVEKFDMIDPLHIHRAGGLVSHAAAIFRNQRGGGILILIGTSTRAPGGDERD
jgi:hypothetical protein